MFVFQSNSPDAYSKETSTMATRTSSAVGVAAGVLTDKDGHILVGKRSNGPFRGKWEFPGGKIETENKETAQEAVIREWKEELDIPVTVGEKIGDYANADVELAVFWVTTEERKETITRTVHETLEFTDLSDLLSKEQYILPLDVVALRDISIICDANNGGIPMRHRSHI